MVKRYLKQALKYRPLPETAAVRQLIDNYRISGLPFCPPDEGDLLYCLANEKSNPCCLEIGFATGSTALYLLFGSGSGSVVSIDYRQSDFDYLGTRLVARSGMGDRHRLIEENTNLVLPELFRRGERFDVMFLDGWKTFDHLLVDIYYCNQLLNLGGYLVFDDTRLPSAHKALRLLSRYYLYVEADAFRRLRSPQLRWWYLLTTRSPRKPYRAFLKTKDFADLEVSSNWSFWRRF